MSTFTTRLAWGLAACAVAGGAFYLAMPKLFGPVVTPVAVVSQEVVQTVVASGTVETTTLVNLGTQITGTVALIYVAEGDRVHADQALLSLADGDARAALAQAQASAAQAEAKLNLIRDVTKPAAEHSLAQAQITLERANQQLARVELLTAQHVASQSALEDAREAQSIAAVQVKAAELAVTSASPGGSDTVYAEAVLQQARATVASAQMKIDYTLVKAPADGIIMSNNANIGMVAQPGSVLMTLAPTGQRRLVLQIDERNLSLLKLGQPALVSADAYAEQVFHAVVSFINPSVNADSGSFEVRLDVAKPPEYIKEGMTVSVDIEVARHKDALVLPLSAIRDASTAKPHVLVIDNGLAVDKAVTLGVKGASATEILTGVKKGDLIIPVSETTVKAGGKVRISNAGSTS